MDELTVEQRAFWDEIGFEQPKANDGQTLQQATNFGVSSIQHVFKFDGYPVPSEEAIRAEFERRRRLAD